jgi:NarL family two-component system response regulator LiaR
MSKRIRILIADDHTVVRSALATFLSVHDDLCLVGEATDGREAVQLCEQVGPDVVLMDVVMPRMDGVTATRLIRAQHPEIQIVALTSFEEVALVQGILTAGAINYLLKTSSGEELAGAIRRAGSRVSRTVVSAPGPHGKATPQAGVKFTSP